MYQSVVACRSWGLAAALFTIMTFVGGCTDKPEDPEALLAQAWQEREKGNHSVAIIHLKNLLHESPDHAEARYLLGASHNDVGDFASAEWELGRALDLQYDQSKVIPLLGQALLMNGHFEQVLERVPAQIDASSLQQAETLTLRARASLGLNKNAEARTMIALALELEPQFADALLTQARIEAQDRNLDKAAKLVDQALASSPDNVEAWLMKGYLNRILGDSDGAINAYRNVLKLRPLLIPVRGNIASLQIDAGNFDQANEQIQSIRENAPNNPLADYLAGLIEFRQKNYTAAQAAVQKVLKVAPDHMPSVLLAGAAEFALDSHTKAQVYLWRVVGQPPENLYARRLLAASLLKTGQASMALDALEQALSNNPENAELITLAGQAHLQNNDVDNAAHFFERAAKLNPDSASVRAQLGMARLASGRTDLGLADLDSASKLDSVQYQADILLVTSFLQQKKYDEALNAVLTLEKKQPNNPLTYNLKGTIYAGKKDNKVARTYFERALELQPTFVPAAENLARLDLLENQPQAARRRFEKILEKDKGNVQALLTLAAFGPLLGTTQKEQIGWLERARETGPDLIQPHLMLAQTHSATGDNDKAFEASQRAHAISPNNFQVLYTLGRMQIATQRKEQAQVTYQKLVALQPDSPRALYGLANAQMAADNPTEAAHSLKKALSLKPDFIDAQIALAAIEVRAKRFQRAIKIARDVQKQNPNAPQGLMLEGDILMRQEKFAQAINAYEAAYRVDKNRELAVRLHAAYTQAGRPGNAERLLQNWLKQSPGDLVVRLYAANAALNSQDYNGAVKHFELLLDAQPDAVPALNNLAWTYQQLQDPRALNIAERAHELAPDSAAVADTLGWILVELGKIQRGRKLLQDAVAAAPETQEIRYHLAQAWLKDGNEVKARAELERLLATDTKFPQRPEAVKLLNQLNH